MEALIEEWATTEPEFPLLLGAAEERRTLMKRLREVRRSAGLSQSLVAARVGTSESAVARLEGGELDTRLSTAVRFAAALGHRLPSLPR